MSSGKTYKVDRAGIRVNDCYNLNAGLPVTADIAIFVLKEPIQDAVLGTDYVEVWNADVSGDMTNTNFTLVGFGGSGPAGSTTF